MKRVLVYSHDTFGLGNIRRMLAIAKDLAEGDTGLSVLVVTGSPMLHAFRIPPRVDYLKLPCLSRTTGGDYGVRYLDMPYDTTVRLRANVLVSTVLDFDPDLLLIDKKPLGVAGELGPALDLLQRRGRETRAVLLLRDILDSPEATRAVWQKNGYHDAIDRYYEQVLVVGSPEVFDLAREYHFPETTRSKVRYCGYLRRERGASHAWLRESLCPGGEPLVVVTAGGGEDGFRLVSAYAGALGTLGAAGVRSVIVCGPEMAPAQRAAIRRTADERPGTRVLEFCDDMMGLMEAADLVVAMSGYNTVCELLTLRKRALLVPRVKPVLEQWIRAERLAALGLASTLHPDSLDPGPLAQAVLAELGRANVYRRGLYQIDLDGLARVRDAVGSLLATAPVRPARDTVVPMAAWQS